MKKLICHGDSLTEAAELDRASAWPSRVARRLNIDVINSGIGGDTTGGLLGRFYTEVVQHHPDLVIIMGGTNDLWWGLDLKLIQANIFTMVCQAVHHEIMPLIALPPPMVVEKAKLQDFGAPEGGYQHCVEQMAVLVKALDLAAGQNEIICLDFHCPFTDNTGKPLEKYFLEDGLHPNEAAHRLMADIAVGKLSGLKG